MRTRRFIELAGFPAAGKSSVAALLAEWLCLRGIAAAIITEPGSSPQVQPLKADWDFNAWTLCKTVENILERDLLQDVDYFILDRGLVDAMWWLRSFEDRGQINCSTARCLRAFARTPRWFNKQLCTIALRDRIGTALVRRRQDVGRIVNAQTFDALWDSYYGVVAELAVEAPTYRIQVIDTDTLTPADVLDRTLAVASSLDHTIAEQMSR